MSLDIPALLKNARPGETITLPAGRFDVKEPLVLSQHGLTLKGQGAGKTVLVMDFPGENLAMAKIAGQHPSEVPSAAKTQLTESSSADAQYVKVADPSKFAVGQVIALRAKNDEAFLKAIGSKVWKKELPHLRQTINRIKAIHGNALALEHPLGAAYPSETEIMPVAAVEHVTVEGLTLHYDLGAAPDPSSYENAKPDHGIDGLAVWGAVSPTIRDVQVIHAGRHAFNFDGVMDAAISHATADGAWNKGEGGAGYFKLARTYRSRMENLHLRNLRHLAIQWSAHDNSITGLDADCDINFHGGFSQRNRVQAVSLEPREGHPWGKLFRTKDTAHWAPPDGEGNSAVDACGKEIDALYNFAKSSGMKR